MRALADRSRSLRRAAVSLLLAAALYDSLARSGAFPPALIPTLPTVGRALIDGLLDGSLAAHTLYTLYRVLLGMGLAIAVGLPLGILMGRSRAIEDFFLPLASALMPIPSLAWVPVFILWFGLGKCHRHRHRFLRRAVPDAAQHVVRSARGQSDLAPRRSRHGRRRALPVLESHRAGLGPVRHHRPTPGLLARLDCGCRRRDAGRLRLGAGLGHLRRQGVPQSRPDASLARRHRPHRLRLRAPGVR